MKMNMMNKILHLECRSALLSCLLLISLAMSQFNISMLNGNGARDAVKRSLLYELMRLKGTAVMFVQETHSDSLNETDWKRESGAGC